MSQRATPSRRKAWRAIPCFAILPSTLILCTAGARAADTTVELAPVVVSATTTERSLTDAPATVTVITGDEIRQRPVQDVADALRAAPGVMVGGIGLNRRGISIRGMPAEHTLILMDGKRINNAGNAIAHADYDLSWVPAEAIERIEVVRGPMSSLYGSEALGGVVNVITRRATDGWHGSLSAKGGLMEGGGGDSQQFGIYAGGPLVPGVLGLSVTGETHGRQPTRSLADPRLTELERRLAATGSATLTWTPDDAQRIDLSYGQGRESRAYTIQSGTTAASIYTTTDEIERRHLSLAHTGDWSWGRSSLRAYRSTLDRESRRSTGTPTDPQTLTDDMVDGHVSVPVLSWNLVTLGGEWHRERLTDSTVNRAGKAEAVHRGLFLQDEIALGRDWSLVLGDRADHHETFGWQHSPRAYLVHHLTNALTVKGGVGKGFKAPTLKQLSPQYQAVAAAGRFTVVGNPALEPETSVTYEVGAEYRGAGWSARATLFQNDLKNLIDTACTRFCGVRGREIRTYQNIEEARIRGLELGGGADLPWDLRLDANYTFLDSEDRATGRELGERPRHRANAALAWTPAAGLTARVRAEYVGRQALYPSSGAATRLPSYTLVSLDLSQALTDSVALRGGVQNLTNQRLAEKSPLFPYAEEGRLYWAGLNYSF